MQNRRRKSDAAIRLRLLSLDYVLQNEQLRFLVSMTERLRFFSKIRHVPTSIFCDCAGRIHPFLSTYPIALVDAKHPATSLVKFVFADEAAVTIEKFARFLAVADPLLRRLVSFEIAFCSNTKQNFSAALHEFRRHFDEKPVESRQLFANDGEPRSQNSEALNARFVSICFQQVYPKVRRDESAVPCGVQPMVLPLSQQLMQKQQHGLNAGSRSG